MFERRLNVRQAFVRGQMSTPKSRAGRRVVELGSHTVVAIQEQFRSSNHRAADSIVFCHPALGTPLDPSKLSNSPGRRSSRQASTSRYGRGTACGMRR